MHENPRDADLQARIAAMERELAELRKRQAAVQNTGPGTAFAGNQDVVIPGSVGGDVKVVYGNVYSGPPTTDPAEALRIYRHVLVAGSRYLPLRGVDVGAGDPSAGQKSLDLARVYIALDTKTQALVEEKPERGRPSRERGEPLREGEKTRPLPALEAAATNRRLVLLGDPGSGKSTFLGHLAHCLAAHALEPQAGWLDHLSGWPDAAALPVTVVLRDFARWLAVQVEAQAEAKVKVKVGIEAEPSLVWEFLGERLRAQNLAFVTDPLAQALEAGQAFLLFDGLDEIAGRGPVRLVRDAVAAFADRYRRCRCLVTCRTLSYRAADWQMPGYPTFELAPFDEAKIDRFVAAWYAELAEQGVVSSGDVAGLTKALAAALRRPDLWRLAPNPLLLTVMALVHTHKGRLPDARALLYEETVEILLWRWEQIKAGGRSDETPRLRQLLLQANRGDVDLKRVLWKLAFEAHSQGGAGCAADAVADIGELRLLRELGGLCCGDLGWAQQVVEAMKLRAGLLVERQPEVFSFPHRTFQEYLAGAHLAAQADFARRAAGLVAEGAHWREVILLAAGKLVYGAGDLDKPLALVGELCPERSHDTPLAWRKAWLAGDVLLEVGPERAGDSQLGQDLTTRVAGRLAELLIQGRLDPVERARAGDTLGRLGDPRPGVRLRPDGLPDIAWCDVSAGEFIMGNTKETDDMAYDSEAPQHREPLRKAYRISKYPITNAQFAAFAVDGGYQQRQYWQHAERAGFWRAGQVRAYHYVEDDWREGWFDGPENLRFAPHLASHPVVEVSWFEAVAFCLWLGDKLELQVSLPTEAQWERAARGTDGRRYPWAGELTSDHANYADTGIGATTAVGIFPKGVTLEAGVLDMSGNVWEWCRTKWRGSYKGKPDDGLDGTDTRVLRGGAFFDLARSVRCAYRYRYVPRGRGWFIGFRVVASPIIHDSGV
ncbi:MAG: SUMF1/EgtB/PvdO family nonheme iron enzyme [Chloroflexi bacterium]|nr:SUMF1/EgtB/PvdO family nonheme iron enzyme [Chloroflexota bacterium]